MWKGNARINEGRLAIISPKNSDASQRWISDASCSSSIAFVSSSCSSAAAMRFVNDIARVGLAHALNSRSMSAEIREFEDSASSGSYFFLVNILAAVRADSAIVSAMERSIAAGRGTGTSLAFSWPNTLSKAARTLLVCVSSAFSKSPSASAPE